MEKKTEAEKRLARLGELTILAQQVVTTIQGCEATIKEKAQTIPNCLKRGDDARAEMARQEAEAAFEVQLDELFKMGRYSREADQLVREQQEEAIRCLRK